MCDESALKLAASLAGKLLQQQRKLVTAESCTGGGIAHLLTSVPGSSGWFERGYVTYSNASKRDVLHVPDNILDEYGAVSEQAAAAMARGALEHSLADYSIAVTGIAGPDGGSADKPVGTVWFAWGKTGGVPQTKRHHFQGDRRQVREQSIIFAVQGLLKLLETPQPTRRE
jgi:nicotinamide-nucleotide amidase